MIKAIGNDGQLHEYGIGTTVEQFEQYEGFGRHGKFGVYFDRDSGHFVTLRFDGYHDEYPGVPDGSCCVVDATPEAEAAWKEEIAARHRAETKASADRAARHVEKGKQLRVVRGRKVPVGTIGRCIWIGSGQFGSRVGLKTEQGEVHFTATSNVEVVL